MWNSSALGGGGMRNSVFEQGGFINDTVGSPGFGSQNEKRKVDRVNNVVPCTIAQILKAPDMDEHMKIGSMSAHILTVIGMVKSVDEQSTRIVYTIDDMTGAPLEVQMWIGENMEVTNEKRSSIMENSYVRVTGSMRTVKGNKLLIAFKVSPVKEVNEITMHLLEVLHTNMAVAVMDSQAVTQGNNGLIKNNFGMEKSAFSMGNQQCNVTSGLNKQQQLVFQVISSDQSMEGVSYDQLYASLQTLSKQVIRDAVDFLSNEGHIYSTIDDDHFKSTDSG
ncbi:replication protein A 32 kDa subunit-like [Centruroides sculpturatus]|uniref:replication protein A 32 kDa subunit-like n=1 Tax=Centruroides sculpturatus TaxID=218467 RepID=UPI000C6D45C7|nr:replication protein A 32 kDa subunit-like [Centruroides sculpturatus]